MSKTPTGNLPVSTIYPPYVIERSSRGERTYDIFSRLLMDRIVFLGTPINDDVANIVIAQLLFLEADNPERDIYLYINSPGGSVSRGHGDLRHDAVPARADQHDLHGHGGEHGLVPAGGRHRGQAQRAAAFAHHDPPADRAARRAPRPTSRSRRKRDPVPAREDERAVRAAHRAQVEQIERDMDRDRFMSADEAKDYGIIDSVIAQHRAIQKDAKEKVVTL